MGADCELCVLFLPLRRLQLGLVVAAHLAELSQAEAARHGRQRTQSFPHRGMVTIFKTNRGFSHCKSLVTQSGAMC